MTRYSVQRRAIYAYEVWNEPTNAMFLNSSGFGRADWEFLGAMLYTARRVIKRLTQVRLLVPSLKLAFSLSLLPILWLA